MTPTTASSKRAAAGLPPWLQHAVDSPPHIGSVIKTLSIRENQRRIARSQHLVDASSGDRSNPARSMLAMLRKQPNLAPFYSVSVGISPQNIDKNRYIDIEPYDRSRVLLEHGRYLNASWVRELYGQRWWIASQAPLPETSHAFLSVLLQPSTHPPPSLAPSPPQTSHDCQVRTIVQLTMNVESGRRKAHPYFPDIVGQTTIVPPEEGSYLPPLKLTLLSQDVYNSAHCVRSTISLSVLSRTTNGSAAAASKSSSFAPNQPRNSTAGSSDSSDEYGSEEDQYFSADETSRVTFTHLLYESWPDHGIPRLEDQASLLEFIRLAHGINKEQPPVSPSNAPLHPDPPMVVGCSAGIGRTGSFIALSSLLRTYGLIESDKPTVDVRQSLQPEDVAASPLGYLPSSMTNDAVAREIDSLREQRPGMVQRNEQALLVYDLLVSAFKGELQAMIS